MDEIKCPLCGCIEEDCSAFVTYWGDEDVNYECSNCGAKLTVHEHVTRTWEIT
jgi:DNA-directed RNA polymerase subunit RPC12/RpoP